MKRQKKILITCFDSYGWYKENISMPVAQKVCEFLKNNDKIEIDKDNPLVFRVDGFSLNIEDKNDLVNRLRNEKNDFVVSMGLYPLTLHKKCILERLKNSNNNIIKNTEMFRVKKRAKYNSSPCHQTRNLLCDISNEMFFQWEFIHIPQHFVKNKCEIEKISQLIYECIIQYF